jgi:fermentation-respiration switch protein FrsA (DUF1100 family)
MVAYLNAFYFPPKRPVVPFSAKNEDEKGFLKGLDLSKSLLKSQPYEEIYVKSFDNLSLFGRYYHTKDSAPLVIEFHGYKGDALRDFSVGDMVFKSLGCNTLLVDQRAHGKSEGKTISFGIYERFDCLSWIRWANERFGNIPIFLAGISMGGATVLMASDLDLPKNVVGIISDCPYSSPKEIICKVCRDFGLSVRFLYPLITLGAVIFGNFNVGKHSAIESVKKTHVPILLLHGLSDSFVPPDMSYDIYKNCTGEKYLFTFEGAGHGFSFATDAPKYEHAIKDFLKKQLI